MTFFIDAVFEQQALNRLSINDRIAANRARAFADPAAVSRLTNYQRNFPWMRPGTMLTLAEAGLDPESSPAQRAAQEAAFERLDNPIGINVPAGRLARGDDSDTLDAIQQRLEAQFTQTRARAKTNVDEQESSDTLVEDLRSSRWFDAEAQMPLRPRTEQDRKSFATDLRKLARRHGLRRGVPFFDPDTQQVMLLPSRGKATPAVGDFDSRDMRRIARGGDPRAGDETAFSRLHPVEQLAIWNSTASGEERAQETKGGGFLDDVLDVVKTTARAGFTLLQAGPQFLTGRAREAERFRKELEAGRDPTAGQSVLNRVVPGQAQTDLSVVFGGGFNLDDLGGGFIPDLERSPVAVERKRREREVATIDEFGFTGGGSLARMFFEPGSKPYNLLSGAADFAGQIVADPAAHGLGKAAKVRQAKRGFGEIGLIPGARKTVNPDTVRRWLDGVDGQALIEGLANTQDTSRIWRGFNRRIDPKLAAQIADAPDAAAVRQLIEPQLGTSIKKAPSAGAFDVTWKDFYRSRRVANITPGRWVDLEDSQHFVTQVERWLRNVKVDDETFRVGIDKAARANDRIERFAFLENMMSDSSGILVKKFNVHPSQAKKLTKMYGDSVRDARKYFIDEIGNTRSPWQRKATIGGKQVDLPSPHLLLEHVNRIAPLPDPRDIRRMTSKFGKILASDDAKLKLPLALVDEIQQSVWKPMVLLRGAWTARVVGEEQLRMAAVGLDSLFHHPMRWIGWVTGKTGSEDILGKSIDEAIQYQRSLTRNAAGIFDERTRHLGWYDEVNKFEDIDRYSQGLAGEITQLHNDTTARIVAREGVERAKVLFWDSEDRLKLAKAGPDGHPEILTRRGADSYVESVADRINIKTQGDPELLRAIREGRLRGIDKDITIQSMAGGGIPQTNPKFVKTIRDIYSEVGPDVVKVERTLQQGTEAFARLNKITDRMFGVLMGTPTNKLSRSPVFRQLYWRNVEDVIGFADDATKAKIIASAEKAGINPARLRAVKAAGDFGLDEIDMLAKGHALDGTKKLLFDLTERSQAFDIARLITPFGEAWRELLTTWTSIISQQPQVIRRAQQLLQGAREQNDFAEMLGAPPGQGFFFENGFGEEVFTYPGSHLLTKTITGVPIPLTGRVQGLNMLGEVFPGVGPMVQIPAGWLPDEPAFDKMRDILLPFGEFDDPASILSWAPSWMRRLAGEGDQAETRRLRHNAAADMANYLASTGSYDIYSEDPDKARAELSRLMSDAKSKSWRLTMIRAAGAFAAPTPPSPEWLVQDKDGHILAAEHLSNEWRFLLDQDPQTASQKFLETFGEDAFLTMQSKSIQLVKGFPVTERGFDWIRENPGIVKSLPNVYGLFAPQGGEFSFDAYRKGIETGALEPLTLEQQVLLGNRRVAEVKYQLAKEKVGDSPSAEQSAWLRTVRQALERDYPGFGETIPGLKSQGERDETINELTRAAKNSKLAKTDAGQGLIKYLRARDKAQAEAESRGRAGFQTSQDTADLREWLRRAANEILTEHKDFFSIWQIFDREMSEDEAA